MYGTDRICTVRGGGGCGHAAHLAQTDSSHRASSLEQEQQYLRLQLQQQAEQHRRNAQEDILAGKWVQSTPEAVGPPQQGAEASPQLNSPMINALLQQWAKGDSVKIQKLQSWARWVIGGRDLTQHALNNAVELKRLEPQVSPPTESSY